MHEQFDWDDLRYFLAAAQRGGFGAAARALKTQQSTVSRRVANLEELLGGALFDRTATGLKLTRLGEDVRREAEQMANALTRVGDAATKTEHEIDGLVRIALTETLADVFVIPHVLPGLMKQFPKLKLDLVIGNTSADLGRREAEIALRFFLTPSGDLVTRRIARMTTEVLARPSLAKKLKKLPLSQWPFVTMWLPGRRHSGRGLAREARAARRAAVDELVPRAGRGRALRPRSGRAADAPGEGARAGSGAATRRCSGAASARPVPGDTAYVAPGSPRRRRL